MLLDTFKNNSHKKSYKERHTARGSKSKEHYAYKAGYSRRKTSLGVHSRTKKGNMRYLIKTVSPPPMSAANIEFKKVS